MNGLLSNKYDNHFVIIEVRLGVDLLVNFLCSTTILSHIFLELSGSNRQLP